jgi:hypothetical protein
MATPLANSVKITVRILPELYSDAEGKKAVCAHPFRNSQIKTIKKAIRKSALLKMHLLAKYIFNQQ